MKTKKYFNCISILAIVLISYSCNKVGAITYPVSTNYGENLLSRSQNYVTKGESYSLEANLEKKCDLRIVITNTSTISSDPAAKPAVWAYNYNKGWTIGNYESKSQTFSTSNIGNNDLNFVFSGENGSCRVDYYENKSTITQTKIFNW
jgi:hypothetical protein